MIVEDDRAVREGLSLIIDGTPGYACVGAFGSVEEGLQLPATLNPDVMLLDINLPGMLGSEGVGFFRSKYPALQVLMLTVYAEQDKVFESICNGASGYMLKKTPPVRLLEAIRETHEGGAPMSPEIARKVFTLFQKTGPPERLERNLTPQEMRILKLLVEGHTYQSTADHLNVS